MKGTPGGTGVPVVFRNHEGCSSAAPAPSQAGWRVLAALLLLPPLVQGGTPRLPVLAVELGILALAAYWAWSWSRLPRRELRLTALDGLLGLLLFWSLFSMVFAPYYHAAEAAFLGMACMAAFYWFLAFHPSFAGLSTALAAVRLQAAGQSLFVLWQQFGAGRPRPPGTFYNPNFLAGFLAAALLLTLGGLLYPTPDGRRRSAGPVALAVAELGLVSLALLLTSSRGGILSLAIGLALLLVVRSWRIACATFAIGAAALLVIPNPFVERLRALPGGDVFAFSRIEIWKSSWAMMLDHPWVGIGLGQFEYVSTRYAFPVTTHWARYIRVAENAHSEYLQAGAELGVPGLLIAVGLVALLALAAVRRLRRLAPAGRGPIVTLLAGSVAICAHAAVDFPLHAPPQVLLLVLFAAGLRLHGATGPEHAVSFRVRPAYAVAAGLVALLLAGAAVRPVAGFWYFLAAIGAPQNLLREKWALEEAPRRAVPNAEAVRLMDRAASLDFVNAPYRRALGSLLFKSYLLGESGEGALRSALKDLNYATELNPNQYQYWVNLGQAMTSLARHAPPGREQLVLALEHYRQAAQLAPFQHQVQSEIGQLADELGDAEAAEAALRRAVTLEEYYLRGWYNLGAFYARRVRYTEAREAFAHGAALAEKARSLVPTSEAEREMIAFQPEVFYNELRKVERVEHPEGATS